MTKADIIARLQHIQSKVRMPDKAFAIDWELDILTQQLQADVHVESTAAGSSCDVVTEVNFKHLMQQLQGMAAGEADIRHLLRFIAKPKRVVNYNVVSGVGDDFIHSANEFIRSGWQPQGGMTVEYGVYRQAMVQYDNDGVK